MLITNTALDPTMKRSSLHREKGGGVSFSNLLVCKNFGFRVAGLLSRQSSQQRSTLYSQINYGMTAIGQMQSFVDDLWL